jgi:cell wall-associated NlpC family hydrolase
MNLRGLFLVSVAWLAFAAPASASGPVFVVVPNAPDPGADASVSPSADSASLQDELTADRHALARALASQRRAMEAFARAQATAASAPLLSEQLDAGRAAAQLQLAAGDAAVEASQLRQQIDTLELQLQPAPAPWTFDPLSASAFSGAGGEAVSIAEEYLGAPYRWGGADPLEGFDCSGLTMFVYAQLGVQLPHYAADQWNDLPHVDPSQMEPGDLVFFEPGWDGPGHVGIFAGGDSFIEAPHTGDVVKIASLSQEALQLGFVGAARPTTTAAGPFGY